MIKKTNFHIVMSIWLGIAIALVAVGAFAAKDVYYNESLQQKTVSLQVKRAGILQDGTSVYEADLPEREYAADSIQFYTNHAEVFVYTDGRLLYSREKGNSIWGRTTGAVIHIFDIPREVTHISIHVVPVYGQKGEETLNVILGNGVQMSRSLIGRSALNVFVCVLIVAVGFCLVVYWLVFLKRNLQQLEVFYLGIFAMLLGTWSLGETDAAVLMLNQRAWASYVAFTCLMLIPVPFVMFVRYFLVMKDKYFHFLLVCYTMGGTVLFQILHFADVLPLKKSALFSHIGIGAALAYQLYAILIYQSRHKGKTRAVVNIVGLVILTFSAVADVFTYYSSGNVSSGMGKFGFLIYIILLGIALAHGSRQKEQDERKLELYRELAEKDILTSCYNRNAYARDMEKEKDFTGKQIMIFDLNNLKLCNDRLGHAAGDRYLMESANTIRNIFGRYGKVYRIGGDEFCAIMPKQTEEKNHSLVKDLRKCSGEYHFAPKEMHLGIACGYAVYEPGKDEDFEATRNRADHWMYENKRKLKEGLT